MASQGLDCKPENIVVADYWEQARPVFSQLSGTVANSSQDKKPKESPRPPTKQTSNDGKQPTPVSTEQKTQEGDQEQVIAITPSVSANDAGETPNVAVKRKRKPKKRNSTTSSTKEGTESDDESSKGSSDKSHYKRQILARSSDESNSDSEAESKSMKLQRSLCQFGHLSNCDCSQLSDNTYSSSSESVSLAVASP